jgi:hypothetical protein
MYKLIQLLPNFARKQNFTNAQNFQTLPKMPDDALADIPRLEIPVKDWFRINCGYHLEARFIDGCLYEFYGESKSLF